MNGDEAVRQAIYNAAIVGPALSSCQEPADKAAAVWRQCAIEPIGICEDRFFYRDSAGAVVVLTAAAHTPLAIAELFAQRLGDLYRLWPMPDRHGAVAGWRWDLAAAELMAACAERGLLNPRRFAAISRGDP